MNKAAVKRLIGISYWIFVVLSLVDLGFSQKTFERPYTWGPVRQFFPDLGLLDYLPNLGQGDSFYLLGGLLSLLYVGSLLWLREVAWQDASVLRALGRVFLILFVGCWAFFVFFWLSFTI